MPDGPPDVGVFPDIPSLRKFMADAKGPAQRQAPPSGIKEEDRQIAMRDGHKITVTQAQVGPSLNANSTCAAIESMSRLSETTYHFIVY